MNSSQLERLGGSFGGIAGLLFTVLFANYSIPNCTKTIWQTRLPRRRIDVVYYRSC